MTNIGMKNDFYITTPIYYASGPPHIGHAFATLYADVIDRYQKSLGKNVFFSAGLDEHGSKIEEKAVLSGKSPQEFVDEIAEKYLDCWKTLNIQYDDFIRTTSQRHKKGVYEFFEKLKKSGDIYESFYEGLYCVDCEKFITEKELKNGLCPDHLKPPQKIKEKNYFFKLQKYLPLIKQKIMDKELKIIPESRENEILAMLNTGIPDFSVSREKVKWGIPYPDDETQTIYVWIEALLNYLTILDFPNGEKFKTFWPADCHVIGAEINKFHSTFWPALLLSAGLPLPKTIFVHGLFTINGQKISKTLGNVIDPIDIAEKFGSDAARYLLLSQFPAEEHGDVKESDFAAKYNADLAHGVGNFFERILTMVNEYKKDAVDKNLIEKEIAVLTEKAENDYRSKMENYRLFDALQAIFSFIKILDKYINEKEPWKLYKNQNPDLDVVLASLFFGLQKTAAMLKPFIPSKIAETENYILKMKNGTLPAGQKLNLFPRK